MQVVKIRSGTAFFFFLLIGIAKTFSLPAAENDKEWYTILPDNASLYAALELSDTTKELVKELLSTSPVLETNQDKAGLDDMVASNVFIINRTDTIYLAVLPDSSILSESSDLSEGGMPDSGKTETNKQAGKKRISYYAILEGDYPLFPINLRLRIRDKWEKLRFGNSCWSSKNSDIKMCLPDEDLLFYSNENMELLWERYRQHAKLEPAPPFLLIQDMIKQETARHAGKDNINNYNPAEMVLFFPQFSRDNFNQFINDEQKDIRDLLIIANRSKREYHLKMIFGLENENVLKSYTKTVRLYLAKFLQETKVTNVENKMQNIIISTPGDKLHVEGLEFTQAEIIKIISVLITGDGV